MLLFLACLPALDMEDPDIAHRVLEAIRDTGASDAERKTLTTIILVRASEAARRLLEGMMTTMEWKSDFIESYVDQGRVLDRREVVLKILDARDLHPTEEQRARRGEHRPRPARAMVRPLADRGYRDGRLQRLTSICWASGDLGALDGG